MESFWRALYWDVCVGFGYAPVICVCVNYTNTPRVFHVEKTWNTRGVFVGKIFQIWQDFRILRNVALNLIEAKHIYLTYCFVYINRIFSSTYLLCVRFLIQNLWSGEISFYLSLLFLWVPHLKLVFHRAFYFINNSAKN